MKITSTLLFILFIAVSANAQDIVKGRTSVGGMLSFARQKNEGTELNYNGKYTWITINPAVGKFYNNNRMVGFNLSYSREKRTVNTYTNHSYGGGLFLRQYVPLAKSFYLFAEEGASFRSSKTRQETNIYKETLKTVNVSLDFYPGLSYAITKRLFAELALVDLVNVGYTKEDRAQVFRDGSPTVKVKSTSFGLSAGLGNSNLGYLGFGLGWILD